MNNINVSFIVKGAEVIVEIDDPSIDLEDLDLDWLDELVSHALTLIEGTVSEVEVEVVL